MSTWLINIIGIIFIGVIVEIVLPSGKTSVFIKGIFSIFVLYVIISPLPNLLNMNLNISNNTSTVIDTNFLINNNIKRASQLEENLINFLADNGFENVGIIITADIYSNDFIIKKIHLDLHNLVLKDKDMHINSTKDIIKLILSKTNVDEEVIVVYE